MQEKQKKQRGRHGKIFNLVLPGNYRKAVRIVAAKREVPMQDYLLDAIRQRLIADGEIREDEE